MTISVNVTYNLHDHDDNFDELIEQKASLLEYDGSDMMFGPTPTRGLFFFAEDRNIAESVAIEIAKLGVDVKITIEDYDDEDDEDLE